VLSAPVLDRRTGRRLHPPLLWYGYPAPEYWDAYFAFRAFRRHFVLVYGVHADDQPELSDLGQLPMGHAAGAEVFLLELGDSRRGVAPRATIDAVKRDFGIAADDEPKWYLDFQRALWQEESCVSVCLSLCRGLMAGGQRQKRSGAARAVIGGALLETLKTRTRAPRLPLRCVAGSDVSWYTLINENTCSFNQHPFPLHRATRSP
jgi:hypothetical protein